VDPKEENLSPRKDQLESKGYVEGGSGARAAKTRGTSGPINNSVHEHY